MATNLQSDKRQSLKAMLQFNSVLVLLLCVTLILALWQVRMVHDAVNGRTTELRQSSFAVNEMTNELGLLLSEMETSSNTFDLNLHSNRLQQKLIKLEELLYGLEKSGANEEILRQLRESADAIKVVVARTLGLQQRKIEREQVRAGLLLSVNDIRRQLDQQTSSLSTSPVWLNQARQACGDLFAALANDGSHRIAQIELNFDKQLLEMQRISGTSPEMLRLTATLQTLGTEKSGVFTILQEVLNLEYATKSNREINFATMQRFKQRAKAFLSEVKSQQLGAIDSAAEMSFVFLAITTLIVFGLLFRIVVVRRYFELHLFARLRKARLMIKNNNQSGNLSGWQDLEFDESTQDDVGMLLMESKLLFERMQRRNRELELLGAVGRELSSASDLDVLLQRLNEQALTMVNADVLLLSLWHPENEEYSFPVGIAVNQDLRGNKTMKYCQQLLSDLGKYEQKRIVQNGSDFHRLFSHLVLPQDTDIGSLLILPLTRHNGVYLGSFCLVSHHTDGFSSGQIKSMETLSRYVAIAMENASTQSLLVRLQNKLHFMDRLNGIRAFEREDATDYGQQVQRQFEMLTDAKRQLTSIVDEIETRIGHSAGEPLVKLSDYLEDIREHALMLAQRFDDLCNMMDDPGEKAAAIELREVLGASISVFKDKFTSIEFVLQGSLQGMVWGKSQQFSLVIGDVLLNACLSIVQRQERSRDFAPKVLVTLSKSKRDILIDVEDNGKGLDEAGCVKILEADFNPARSNAGRRISLTAALNIVEAMSGELSIESLDVNANKVSIKVPIYQPD